MVDSKHQWKAWLYLLPAIILLLIFTVWPIINTVVTAFIYDVDYQVAEISVEPAENGYRFYRTNEADQKEYLNVGTDDSGAPTLQYVIDQGTVFTHSTEYDAWIATVAEKNYFLGSDDNSQLSIFEITDESAPKIGVSLYPMHLYLTTKHTKITEGFDAATKYRPEVFKGVAEAYVYAMLDVDSGYLSATQTLD